MVELITEDEFIAKAQSVPLQKLEWELARQKGVEVLIRRDDLIDGHLSGNKFYKLFYNLQFAKRKGYSQLLSFGGAYSNHIYALAAAARYYGFKSVGVIRGERPAQLSPTLRDAEAWGMKLHFVSRSDYRDKSSPELLAHLTEYYGDFFVIPEGGANHCGIQGAKVLGEAIYDQIKSDYTSICLACGTGNTLAGIAAGLNRKQNVESPGGYVLGISVLKEARDIAFNCENSLGNQIIDHQHLIDSATSNWRLISGFHGGGYGKKLPADIYKFMLAFEHESKVQLDPVYTVKMCWAVHCLLIQNYWPRGSRIVLVHTGGLQGRRGFNL